MVWDKSDNSLEFPDGATLVVESTTGRGDLELANGGLNFNDSSSGANIFQAYYYGGNTWVGTASGGLKLRAYGNDQKVHLIAEDGTSSNTGVDYVVADGSTGEVQLSHYGSEKISTKSTGVKVTGTIELNHADDTTISRVSPGVIAVQGKNLSTVDDATALAIALG